MNKKILFLLSILFANVCLSLAQNVKWSKPEEGKMEYSAKEFGTAINKELFAIFTTTDIQLYDKDLNKKAVAKFYDKKKDRLTEAVGIFSNGTDIYILLEKKMKKKRWIVFLKKYDLKLKVIENEILLGESNIYIPLDKINLTYFREKDHAYITFPSVKKGKTGVFANIIRFEKKMAERTDIKRFFPKAKFKIFGIERMIISNDETASFLTYTSFYWKDRKKLKKNGYAKTSFRHYYLCTLPKGAEEINVLDFNDLQKELWQERDKRYEFQDLTLINNPVTNNPVIIALTFVGGSYNQNNSTSGYAMVEINASDFSVLKYTYTPYTNEAIKASQQKNAIKKGTKGAFIRHMQIQMAEYSNKGSLYVVTEQFREAKLTGGGSGAQATNYSYSSGIVVCTKFNSNYEVEWSTTVAKFIESWNDLGLHVSTNFILDGETVRFAFLEDITRMKKNINDAADSDSLSNVGIVFSDEDEKGKKKKVTTKNKVNLNSEITFKNSGMQLTSISPQGVVFHQLLEERVTGDQLPVPKNAFLFGNAMIIPAHRDITTIHISGAEFKLELVTNFKYKIFLGMIPLKEGVALEDE